MQPASRAMMVGANRRALHPSIRDSMSNDPKMICAGVCVGKCPVIHTGQSLSAFQNSHRKTDRCLACTYDHLSLWSLWMIPYLLHVPPVLIIIIIIITSHTRLVGNCRAGTPHIHTVDIVMFWTARCASITSRVCTCSCCRR